MSTKYWEREEIDGKHVVASATDYFQLSGNPNSGKIVLEGGHYLYNTSQVPGVETWEQRSHSFAGLPDPVIASKLGGAALGTRI